MNLWELLGHFEAQPPKSPIYNKEHKELCDLLKTLVLGIEAANEKLNKLVEPDILRPDRSKKIG